MWFGAWRVNGSLSVSRAIGDAEHKPYISGEPDIAEFNLEGVRWKSLFSNANIINILCFMLMLFLARLPFWQVER